jgi:hypothetical protein
VRLNADGMFRIFSCHATMRRAGNPFVEMLADGLREFGATVSVGDGLTEPVQSQSTIQHAGP